MKNFIISFLGYLATIVFTYLLFEIMHRVGVSSAWEEIILWLHVLVVVTFLFFLGTKLNLLGNHWLNFLSVSGILVIGLYLTFSRTYWGIFVQVVFSNLGFFITRSSNSDYVAFTILSILPSILIWLGMFYKSKRA